MSNARNFSVLSPIDHDNKRYEIGSTIKLSDEKQIEALRAAKAIPDEPKVDPAPELIGRSTRPDKVSKKVMDDSLAKAHADSGLSIEDWNALAAADRDAKIDVVIAAQAK